MNLPHYNINGAGISNSTTFSCRGLCDDLYHEAMPARMRTIARLLVPEVDVMVIRGKTNRRRHS